MAIDRSKAIFQRQVKSDAVVKQLHSGAHGYAAIICCQRLFNFTKRIEHSFVITVQGFGCPCLNQCDAAANMSTSE